MATLVLRIENPSRPITYKYVNTKMYEGDIYEMAATACGWRGKKKENCPNPLWYLSTCYVVEIKYLTEGEKL